MLCAESTVSRSNKNSAMNSSRGVKYVQYISFIFTVDIGMVEFIMSRTSGMLLSLIMLLLVVISLSKMLRLDGKPRSRSLSRLFVYCFLLDLSVNEHHVVVYPYNLC